MLLSACRSVFSDQHLDDTSRAKIENDYERSQLTSHQITCLLPKCIYHDRCRLCNTDRIRQLDLAPVSQTCCNDVLSNITCCICCGTVNLCAVLSRESTAAVTSHSTICIYDNLTSGKTCITVWSTNNETSGRVDEELCLIIYQFSRQDRVKDIFLDVFMDPFLCYIFVMLCRKNNSLKSLWLTSLIIFYRNLCLSVWS